MVDSGALTVFINKRFIKGNWVSVKKLDQHIPLFNIDGTPNALGRVISELATLGLTIGDHIEKDLKFHITDIGPKDVIIRIDWL